MKWLSVVLLLGACQGAAGQDESRYLTPIATQGQAVSGPSCAQVGAVGIEWKRVAEGFIVLYVSPGGPAQRAGVRVGDVLTRVDDQVLAGAADRTFSEALKKKPGDKVHLALIRTGSELG